ncbi:hypothetical protein HY640_01735 [Candidatus Woesearchaeota archaeon]|nr:hypothetical protein [Candidatus Woesearchaeota archaeon]
MALDQVVDAQSEERLRTAFLEAEKAIRTGSIADAYRALHSFRHAAYVSGDGCGEMVTRLEKLAQECVVKPFQDCAKFHSGSELAGNYGRIADSVKELLQIQKLYNLYS